MNQEYEILTRVWDIVSATASQTEINSMADEIVALLVDEYDIPPSEIVSIFSDSNITAAVKRWQDDDHDVEEDEVFDYDDFDDGFDDDYDK